MRRKVIFDLEARLEFEDAVVWYNEREPGLGNRFEAEVNATIQRILKDPERFPLRGSKIRRTPVETFNKYSILFRIEPDFIGVAAVFHGARDPAQLRRRLK
jgi:plasmid stabilization system protein ParE